jgi:hypothetical protein
MLFFAKSSKYESHERISTPSGGSLEKNIFRQIMEANIAMKII